MFLSTFMTRVKSSTNNQVLTLKVFAVLSRWERVYLSSDKYFMVLTLETFTFDHPKVCCYVEHESSKLKIFFKRVVIP